MAQTDTAPPGPDLALGVPLASVPTSGVLAGHVDGAAVLLARLDDGIFAVSGACSHYGAPLAEGTTSPAPRRKTGFRCSRPGSTATGRSICASPVKSLRSRPGRGVS